MSLINQMLKDLEARATQSAEPAALLTGLQTTVIKERRTKKSYLLILVLLSLIFVWVWNATQYYFHRHPGPVKVQKSKTLVSRKPILPAAAPVAITPLIKQVPPVATTTLAALTGISMQIHGKMTYLRFLLNREAFYQVNSDPLQHSIIITLKNTDLSVNVPPLDFVNGALADLKISSTAKNELQLVLILKPEAKLSNLELNKESSYPELQADFLMETPAPLNKAAVQENKTVSEPATGILKKTAVELSTAEKYQEALSLAEAGDHEKAMQLLAVLIDKYPEYNLAREALIALLIQQGKQEKALQLLTEGLHLQPFYPPFVEIKAHLLVNEGKIYQALNLLKKAPPALATNPEYYAFIAALYQRLGQLPSAENLYQQLTALHPEKGVWWLGLGVTEEGLGKSAQALEAYTKADKSPDLDPELRGYVGTRLRG